MVGGGGGGGVCGFGFGFALVVVAGSTGRFVVVVASVVVAEAGGAEYVDV